jgi:hypothetical protein
MSFLERNGNLTFIIIWIIPFEINTAHSPSVVSIESREFVDFVEINMPGILPV